jgi:hypothetical protein
VFGLDKSCFKWSNYFLLKCFLPLTGIMYYIIFFITNIYFQLFFLYKFFIYFYAVKDVLVNPSYRKEHRVYKLTMPFDCPHARVGTTVDPNVPLGISKMFIFDLIFFYLFFFYYGSFIFFFIFFKNFEIFFFFLLF